MLYWWNSSLWKGSVPELSVNTVSSVWSLLNSAATSRRDCRMWYCQNKTSLFMIQQMCRTSQYSHNFNKRHRKKKQKTMRFFFQVWFEVQMWEKNGFWNESLGTRNEFENTGLPSFPHPVWKTNKCWMFCTLDWEGITWCIEFRGLSQHISKKQTSRQIVWDDR